VRALLAHWLVVIVIGLCALSLTYRLLVRYLWSMACERELVSVSCARLLCCSVLCDCGRRLGTDVQTMFKQRQSGWSTACGGVWCAGEPSPCVYRFLGISLYHCIYLLLAILQQRSTVSSCICTCTYLAVSSYTPLYLTITVSHRLEN